MINMFKSTIVALLLILMPLCASAENLYGTVTKVIDGDTIQIENFADNERYKVRLACIDAPEKKQSYGSEAKDYLTRLIDGLDVEVKVTSTDLYGRKIGIIKRNNLDINAIMLINGYAWHYQQYDRTENRDIYCEYEQTARDYRLGLWQDEAPVAPWLWRKEKH